MHTRTPISRTKPLWLALVLLILATLLFVACGGTQAASQPAPTATTAPTATDTPTPIPTTAPTTAPAAPTTAPTQNTQIQIVDSNGQYAFQPATITVKKGAQITWTNMTQAPHTVTSDTSAFTASNTLNNNDTFKMVFTTPGTYAYHCAIHSYMTATITVTA